MLKIEWERHYTKKAVLQWLKEVEDVSTRKGRLEYAALAGARVVAQEARRLAPRDTGAAAKTIRATHIGSVKGEAHVVVAPSRKGYYLMFQEFGTSNIPAKPFLAPALDTKQQEALQVMAERFARSLARVRQGRA